MIIKKLKYLRKKRWIDVYFYMPYTKEHVEHIKELEEILIPFANLLGWELKNEERNKKGSKIKGMLIIQPKNKQQLSAEELRDKKKDLFAIASHLCERLAIKGDKSLNLQRVTLDSGEKELHMVHQYGPLQIHYKLRDRIEFDKVTKQKQITKEIFKQELEGYCAWLLKEKQPADTKKVLIEIVKNIKPNEQIAHNELPHKSRFVTETWTERGQEHIGVRLRRENE